MSVAHKTAVANSFKKTKSMAALLEERSRRQRSKQQSTEVATTAEQTTGDSKSSLKSLVESVKRKSAAVEVGIGKRRKL